MRPLPDHNRTLTISTQTVEPERVSITVADAGVGLDAATADRIFASFFTTKRNGMGLALSICRSIIEAHGGRIGVSRNSGGGTAFQLTLRSRGEGS
jgi:signal transduction histidine kinase